MCRVIDFCENRCSLSPKGEVNILVFQKSITLTFTETEDSDCFILLSDYNIEYSSRFLFFIHILPHKIILIKFKWENCSFDVKEQLLTPSFGNSTWLLPSTICQSHYCKLFVFLSNKGPFSNYLNKTCYSEQQDNSD
jgi:hypothetical protein